MAEQREVKLAKDQFEVGPDGAVTIRSAELAKVLQEVQDGPWSPVGPIGPGNPNPKPAPIVIITF